MEGGEGGGPGGGRGEGRDKRGEPWWGYRGRCFKYCKGGPSGFLYALFFEPSL